QEQYVPLQLRHQHLAAEELHQQPRGLRVRHPVLRHAQRTGGRTTAAEQHVLTPDTAGRRAVRLPGRAALRVSSRPAGTTRCTPCPSRSVLHPAPPVPFTWAVCAPLSTTTSSPASMVASS